MGRRRYNLHLQMSPSWDERAKAAVELFARHVTDGSVSVADLGCGNERLRPVLEAALDRGVRYQGYDIHPQLPTTRRLDLRHELPESHFDAVFCLGFLQCLPELDDFVAGLPGVCDVVGPAMSSPTRRRG